MSIVLPTYNRGKTLKRAIDSVLNQTFNDFELIIVDDRSTDDTHKVLREYGGNNQIRVVSRFDKTGLFDESLPRFITVHQTL